MKGDSGGTIVSDSGNMMILVMMVVMVVMAV